MSTVKPPTPKTERVDLAQLAVQRQATPVAGGAGPPRRWLTRYVLPGAILLGFAMLFVWAARDTFFPAQRVTVLPVIVTRAEVQQEGTSLFQAAGWIEPSPTPTVVTALAPGVVEELFVVEGERVEAGQRLARLNDVDARLELRRGEAALRLAEADVESAKASLHSAETLLANPNELQAALADADSLLAETRLTLGNLPFMIDAARSRVELATEGLQAKESAGEGVTGRVLREARGELAAAKSALAELEARGPQLEAQREALERKRNALADQLRLMTSEKQAVSAAQGALAAAEARRDQAQLAVDVAQLTLERMTIRSPMAGRVLTVDAQPGMRLAGMDPASEKGASAVVSLYDPKKLQVRVDVRLEDVPQVRIGQPATIETASLQKPLAGKVSWVTTRADIQKNTLQVKVTIDDPVELITPEMLGRVTFLAPPLADDQVAANAEVLRLLVPRELVMTGEGGATVWIVNPADGTARRQSVELGRAGTEALVEVTAGLDPTSKLIAQGRESLTDGARLRIESQEN